MIRTLLISAGVSLLGPLAAILAAAVIAGCGTVSEEQTTVGLTDNDQTGNVGIQFGETIYFGDGRTTDAKSVKPVTTTK